MISGVYKAFRAVGVPVDRARLAVETFNSESLATKSDIARLETGIRSLDRRLAIVKLILGLVVGGVTSLAVNQLSLANLFDERRTLQA
jgi:hypothetical protein